MLSYAGEPGLLEACQRRIDYYNYVSSYDLKVQCYNMVAGLLREALVSLIDYRGAQYDALRARWAGSNLKYYRVLKAEEVEASMGASTTSGAADVENVEEIPIKYVEPLDQRLEKWFSCRDARFVQ